jgi:hypothetical protein
MRLGAKARLEQLRPQLEDLQVEVDYLTTLIREDGNGAAQVASVAHDRQPTVKRSPGQYERSQEQRERMSRRMKAYWREQRKQRNAGR